MDETQLITDEKHVATVPEVTDNGNNETGKKKRKRKYSQKQLERWMKYREKKSLEKKMNARNNQASVMAIDGTHQHTLISVASNLRAEAEEFVPRSSTLTYPKQLSEPSDNPQIEENDEETQANSVKADSNGNVTVDAEDFGAESSFGILSIYAASELHSLMDKVCITRFKCLLTQFVFSLFFFSNKD
jgi:hypothetical protein